MEMLFSCWRVFNTVRIPFQVLRSPCFSKNFKSVVGSEHIVRDKVNKEVFEDHILGPFPSPLVPNLRVPLL